MRFHIIALALLAAPLSAQQQPRQLTADDYARAERYLGATTGPLVTGNGGRPTWLADGRLWYRAVVPNGSAFFIVDPARRTRESGLRPGATRRGARRRVRRPDRWQPDCHSRRSSSRRTAARSRSAFRTGAGTAISSATPVRAADSTAGVARAARTRACRPTAAWAVFIRDYNLWAKDLATRARDAAHDRRRQGFRLRDRQRRLDAQRATRS